MPVMDKVVSGNCMPPIDNICSTAMHYIRMPGGNYLPDKDESHEEQDHLHALFQYLIFH